MSTSRIPETYIPYAERPDWADVTPIPQHDSLDPLVPIHYTPEYKDATDYFRGVVQAGERSERVLDLTEYIISLNPSHYSVWQYRYSTLIALKSDLAAELKLMNTIAAENLKSYQVWHHRRLLLTQLRSAEGELDFIAAALEEDKKNYHTWAYRQWVLAEFNDDEMWAGELGLIEKLLDKDVRNNSAWSHRFFIVWDSGIRKGEEDRETVTRRELAYTKEMISLAPNNASAWNYLRGVLERTATPLSSLEAFVAPYARAHSHISGFITPASNETEGVFIDLENPLPSESASLPCPLAIEFLADIWEEKGGEEGAKKASEYFASLAEKYDPMRKRYWEFRQKEAQAPHPVTVSA
ncbi:hypothetical protein BOTBODRAFT_37357 [Botryobasidium botryosum FD-172 SS1]|uniref:Protein farnesyltransferase/geranylgeranyltransferase type-1 subunit alpha n=1 Tax=Botryobasidium botryosum (strain FD-172 SS1) TaxID=930990 RepID=A0A067M0M9_BOTB1|nr:hypothetical protein BOTBODRAFT_37357 [Botryobasidium botryosum FD-172 SS1]